MASGRLATENVTTVGTAVQIYQVPSSHNASVTINVCNRGTSNAKVRIAVTDSTTPALGEWLDFEEVVFPKESYQRTGVVLGSAQYIYFYTDQANISVNVYGFEEAV
jgi:hypothetical protein